MTEGPCPNCGHNDHHERRCMSTTDEGQYMCACNFPGYDNFVWTPTVAEAVAAGWRVDR